MITKSQLTAAAILALILGAQWVAIPAYATEQGQQRKEARDTRQEGREAAKQQKAECKEGDDKSRAECRHEKRDTKQEAREAARDIKRK